MRRPNLTTLEKMYWNDGLTMREIGNAFGIGASTISRYIKKFGIACKPRGFKKGYHLSPAHRAKISASEKGKQISDETRAKLRVLNLGRKPTAETRAKISAANMGHGISEETRTILSAAKAGEKNPFWLGGISRQKRSVAYGLRFNRFLREIIRDRDNHLCQFPECYCPENGKKHDCHHIDFIKTNDDPANLITLCPSCHSLATSGDREYWTEFYQRIQEMRGLFIENKT